VAQLFGSRLVLRRSQIQLLVGVRLHTDTMQVVHTFVPMSPVVIFSAAGKVTV